MIMPVSTLPRNHLVLSGTVRNFELRVELEEGSINIGPPKDVLDFGNPPKVHATSLTVQGSAKRLHSGFVKFTM